MPAPRKPTAVLEASGAFRHDPGRRRDPEPTPEGPLGDPPAGLTDGAVACWAEIIAWCSGWVTVADRWAAEVACVLMDKFRRDDITPQELGHLRAAIGVLGMNPADRSKISVVKNKTANEYADLAEESRSFARPN